MNVLRPAPTCRYILLLAAILWLGPAPPHGAQSTAEADPEEAVTQEIQSYAQRHVKGGAPLQTSIIIELCRDNAAGLSAQQVARIYEEEYTRQKEARKPSEW